MAVLWMRLNNRAFSLRNFTRSLRMLMASSSGAGRRSLPPVAALASFDALRASGQRPCAVPTFAAETSSSSCVKSSTLGRQAIDATCNTCSQVVCPAAFAKASADLPSLFRAKQSAPILSNELTRCSAPPFAAWCSAVWPAGPTSAASASAPLAMRRSTMRPADVWSCRSCSDLDPSPCSPSSLRTPSSCQAHARAVKTSGGHPTSAWKIRSSLPDKFRLSLTGRTSVTKARPTPRRSWRLSSANCSLTKLTLSWKQACPKGFEYNLAWFCPCRRFEICRAEINSMPSDRGASAAVRAGTAPGAVGHRDAGGGMD
mmetsp:Transcript_89155/g.255272  ORF Transcript_89155/g.255272 Transcript_89155/m.255272 type:complete len:315 (-) Transcript_89155:31-975(-)